MLKAVAIWLSTEKLPVSDLGDGVWAGEEAKTEAWRPEESLAEPRRVRSQKAAGSSLWG